MSGCYSLVVEVGVGVGIRGAVLLSVLRAAGITENYPAPELVVGNLGMKISLHGVRLS